MSTSTSLRTSPGPPPARPSPHSVAAAEPDVLARERAVLPRAAPPGRPSGPRPRPTANQARGVDRRQGRRRVRQDATGPDREVTPRPIARRGRPTSSGGGRSSTPRIRARPRPRPSSPPPAAGSPAESSTPSARPPRPNYNRAKNEAAAALEAGHKKAAGEHAAAMKPLIESVRDRRRLSASGWPPSPPPTPSSSSTPTPPLPSASRIPSSRTRSTRSSTASPGWSRR